MLLELRIRDLALVEDLVLPVGPGLTVLTGETGAGKSLLAAAVAALAGGVVDKEQVRAGAETTWVEGVFSLAEREDLRRKLVAAGVPLAGDDLLVVRREIRREGRNRVLLNGLTTSLAVLQRLGPLLVSVQSQDQQRELSRPAFFRDLLDDLGGCAELRAAVTAAWHRWREASRALAEMEERTALARQQADIWRFQLAELQEAALRPGEEEELRERAAWKRDAVKVAEALAAAWSRLEADDGTLVGRIQAAGAELARYADDSPRLRDVVALLESGAAQVQEAILELDRLREGWDADPAGLDELEERLHLYQRLQDKYGRDVPGLLALQERLERDLAELADGTERHAALRAERDTAAAALREAAGRLREARRSAAPLVAARLLEEVRPLALPHLELTFEVTPRETGRDGDSGPTLPGDGGVIGPHGADAVRLLARTNPGEPAGELRQIASGGERSRFLLGATALRTTDRPPLLQLFDEVDAGVGADTAPALAAALRRLARRCQVLCITHLPTLAVHGDRHWVAEKSTSGGRTHLRVRPVTEAEREGEIARLLGGSGAARAHAARLLAEAGGSEPKTRRAGTGKPAPARRARGRSGGSDRG